MDVLGDGAFVTVPPSQIPGGGEYRFLGDGLEALDLLLPMKKRPIEAENVFDFDEYRRAKNPSEMRDGDSRSNYLFRELMRAARCVDDLDGLLDVARTRNADIGEPLTDDEVIATATSAWGYEQRGENRFGQHGAWLPLAVVDQHVGNPYFLALIAFLEAHTSLMQGPVGAPPTTSVASSRARSPPTCLCKRQPSTNWRST
jgi:hypothetical protein